MYYIHNLRSDLQEWKSRVAKSTWQELGNRISFFFNNIKNSSVLFNLLNEACLKYPFSIDRINEIQEGGRRGGRGYFNSEEEQAAYSYQMFEYFINEYGADSIANLDTFMAREFSDTKNRIVEEGLAPIVHYLQDKLNKSNSTIYLLEKYKKRTEWFTKDELLKKYESADKNYEELLEKDLRLFLFDQGIDNPFSNPRSPSGRADIIGALDTADPLIVEVKVLDKNKRYGKSKIRDGFSQIVQYTNDYQKDLGYLVVFNMDYIEVNLNFNNKLFPKSVTYNNKTYFIVVVNLRLNLAASKIGKTESIEITESDLF